MLRVPSLCTGIYSKVIVVYGHFKSKVAGLSKGTSFDLQMGHCREVSCYFHAIFIAFPQMGKGAHCTIALFRWISLDLV